MAKSNAYSVILAPFSVSPGGTKASPSKDTGAFNLQPNYGTGITVAMTNGASAPSAPLQAQIQVSGDQGAWRDYGPPLVGDTVSGSSNSWSVDVPKHYMYARVIAHSAGTNPVTLSVETQAATGL